MAMWASHVSNPAKILCDTPIRTQRWAGGKGSLFLARLCVCVLYISKSTFVILYVKIAHHVSKRWHTSTPLYRLVAHRKRSRTDISHRYVTQRQPPGVCYLIIVQPDLAGRLLDSPDVGVAQLTSVRVCLWLSIPQTPFIFCVIIFLVCAHLQCLGCEYVLL